MNFEQAIQAMLEGKKVRNVMWSDYRYVYFDDNCFYDQFGSLYHFGQNDYGSLNEWEIVED